MQKSDNIALLKKLILTKENEVIDEGKLLKAQFHITYESFKPVNLLKNAFKGSGSKSDLQSNIIDAIIRFTTGHIAKKMVIGNTDNTFKKVIGNILETVIATGVAKNAGGIKLLVSRILKK